MTNTPQPNTTKQYLIAGIPNGPYRCKTSVMRAYAEMQNTAIMAGKTVKEMALEMGFSCVYQWLQAIIKE